VRDGTDPVWSVADWPALPAEALVTVRTGLMIVLTRTGPTACHIQRFNPGR